MGSGASVPSKDYLSPYWHSGLSAAALRHYVEISDTLKFLWSCAHDGGLGSCKETKESECKIVM